MTVRSAKSRSSLVRAGGGSLTYRQVANRKLDPGVYELGSTMEDGPVFCPIEADNDPPLEVDPQITATLDEMQHFFTKADAFRKFGFAHKRGYLLHGPPGCGKSSALRLLQLRFVERFGGVVLIWRPSIGTPQVWVELIRENEGNRPVMVVCEDIDSDLRRFETHILEFLDGQKALNNFVLVATTNHLEVIPDRIRNRPSRIDRVIEVPLPPEPVRAAYLVRLGLEPTKASELAQLTPNFSMAQLKEVVVGTECLEQPLEDVMRRLGRVPSADLVVAPKRRSISDILGDDDDDND